MLPTEKYTKCPFVEETTQATGKTFFKFRLIFIRPKYNNCFAFACRSISQFLVLLTLEWRLKIHAIETNDVVGTKQKYLHQKWRHLQTSNLVA